MSQYICIHPQNPQGRLLQQAVNMINQGGVIVYPTDSGYSLACHLGDKKALERIRQIRRLKEDHLFTLVCRDLSELSLYAKVDNPSFRLLKNYTPGPYTFLLPATKEVPRRLLHPNRKTVGLHIPETMIAAALLEELGQPLMSTSLSLPDSDIPLIEPEAIKEILGHQVDLIIDGGYCGQKPSTVIDLSSSHPKVIRIGNGDPTPFL
ncbi:MAG: putative protein YciO [Legionellaceae bacterium]